MNLGGTFAKRFEMIKHACHFRRTLLVVLVFEATLKLVVIGMLGRVLISAFYVEGVLPEKPPFQLRWGILALFLG
jgi:hypothetical protein